MTEWINSEPDKALVRVAAIESLYWDGAGVNMKTVSGDRYDVDGDPDNLRAMRDMLGVTSPWLDELIEGGNDA